MVRSFESGRREETSEEKRAGDDFRNEVYRGMERAAARRRAGEGRGAGSSEETPAQKLEGEKFRDEIYRGMARAAKKERPIEPGVVANANSSKLGSGELLKDPKVAATNKRLKGVAPKIEDTPKGKLALLPDITTKELLDAKAEDDKEQAKIEAKKNSRSTLRKILTPRTPDERAQFQKEHLEKHQNDASSRQKRKIQAKNERPEGLSADVGQAVSTFNAKVEEDARKRKERIIASRVQLREVLKQYQQGQETEKRMPAGMIIEPPPTPAVPPPLPTGEKKRALDAAARMRAQVAARKRARERAAGSTYIGAEDAEHEIEKIKEKELQARHVADERVKRVKSYDEADTGLIRKEEHASYLARQWGLEKYRAIKNWLFPPQQRPPQKQIGRSGLPLHMTGKVTSRQAPKVEKESSVSQRNDAPAPVISSLTNEHETQPISSRSKEIENVSTPKDEKRIPNHIADAEAIERMNGDFDKLFRANEEALIDRIIERRKDSGTDKQHSTFLQQLKGGTRLFEEAIKGDFGALVEWAGPDGLDRREAMHSAIDEIGKSAAQRLMQQEPKKLMVRALEILIANKKKKGY